MAGFDPISAALSLAILAFSVIVHEVAHGYVAYRLGDPTARMAGRLTFNPIPHIDPVGTIILPLLLRLVGSSIVFGWAKPVPINPGYFRHPRRDDILVSIAGVTSNAILAVAAGIAFRIVSPAPDSAIAYFLVMFCAVNICLAVFNMLPIPPLDGSHVVANFLPANAARAYGAVAPFGFIIVVILMSQPIVSYIFGSVIRIIMWLLMYAPAGWQVVL